MNCLKSDSLNILLPGNTSRGFLKTNPLAPPYSLISDKIKPRFVKNQIIAINR